MTTKRQEATGELRRERPRPDDETPTCRYCGAVLRFTFADLGSSPLANAYLTQEELRRGERFYPLHAYLCEECLLVQLEEFQSPEEIFGDYAYFSSYSDSWLAHASAYADTMTRQLGLNGESLVLELASNDGYLLQYFVEKGVPVLGVEPATNVAEVAQEKGIPTLTRFFGAILGRELAESGRKADLVVGNNVLAHVPDLNDFVRGIKHVLQPEGVVTMEFPHVLRLMAENQFDTIYHEHFSYFSFLTVERVFAHHGITLFDVEEIPTHGGSLRIYGCHESDDSRHPTNRVHALREKERRADLHRPEGYAGFGDRVHRTKRRLLRFLVDAKEQGKCIVGYGAAAKGNTLLNYCGIRRDFLDYVVDRSPHKQGLYLPGTHIRISPPGRIDETQPDIVLILPWNLREEIMATMSHVREWGGQFVVPIPEVKVL